MVSVSGYGLIDSARQKCFPLPSATGECFIPRPLCRSRSYCCIKSIRIPALDEKLLVRHNPLYAPSSSKGFVPSRQWIILAASNPRVASSKQVASKGSSNDQDRSRTSGKGQSRAQEPKLAKKGSPTTFPKAAVDISRQQQQQQQEQQQQNVVKDGFAGLSALKFQLEQQRSGVSRVNIGDNQNVGTPLQQPRGEDQRREAETLARSRIAPKSAVNRGTGSQQVAQGRTKDEPPSQNSNSNYTQQTRDGRVTKTAASKFPDRRDSLIPNTSSSTVKDRWEKEKLDVGAHSSAAGVRPSAKGESSTAETRIASADQKRSVGGGKEKDRALKRRNRNRYVEAEQNQQLSTSADTPALTEETDVSKELGSGDKPTEETESADEGKVTGKSIMEAFQRVAEIRQSSRSKPKRKQGSTFGSESDSDSEQRSSKQDPLPPFAFKADWGPRIRELENDVKNLRQLL